MRALICLLVCFLASSVAFVPLARRNAATRTFSMNGKLPTRRPRILSLLTDLSLPPAVAKMGKSAAALVTGALLISAVPAPSFAASSKTWLGSQYSEVIDPKDAKLSESGLSDDAKSGLSSIKSYISAVQAAKADLAKDSNTELYSRLQKSLEPSAVRTSLNKFNSAFDEDTQRGTDRLIRLVLQDLTELDRETQVKPGKARADVKVAIINKRLSATEEALKSLSDFAK